MTAGSRLIVLLAAALVTAAVPGEVNLLSLGEGALPTVEPPSYGSWTARNLIDDAASSGWCSVKGRTANNTFVFELPASATLTAFEFDTVGIDGSGRGAKDLTVEVSSTVDGGFQKVLQASLDDRKDGQRFAASAKLEARFVRLTVLGVLDHPTWRGPCRPTGRSCPGAPGGTG